MNNIKSDRFRRVAALRVQKVLDNLDSLAKCSNRNNYEYTSEDVRKMLRAIRAKLKHLDHVFSENNGSTKPRSFTF
jgi:hypothetical protein